MWTALSISRLPSTFLILLTAGSLLLSGFILTRANLTYLIVETNNLRIELHLRAG